MTLDANSSQAASDPLAGVALFAPLGPPLRAQLTHDMTPARFAPGEVVVHEGDVGDAVYAIVSGEAEVTTTRYGRPVVLATLGPQEAFGALALLEPDGQRRATVTATSALHTLRLDRARFEALLARAPELSEWLGALSERLLAVKLLKRASPFQRLDAARAQRLVGRLTPRSLARGEVLICEGEHGDEAYLLRAGSLRVEATGSDGQPQRLATLKPGALVGESALLAEARRNATVCAEEDSVVLVLQRGDLLEVMRDDATARRDLHAWMASNARPRKTPGVVAHTRPTDDGAHITTLHDPARRRYFRLSARGWRVWQRMDGHTTLRELAMVYAGDRGLPRPDLVLDLLGKLSDAGFVCAPALRADVPDAAPLDAAADARGPRLLSALHRAATWRWTWRGADRAFAALYRSIGPLACARPTVWAMGLLGVLGLAALGMSADRIADSARHMTPALWLLLLPMTLAETAAHEAAHGLATKHAGRAVNGAGVGWYWFTPIAFVDTSDGWLASRRERLHITLAGPWVNLALGGLCALVATQTRGPTAALLWQFAALNYASILANLNPLMKLDGYYLLIDALDRPNLRQHAMHWLRHELPSAIIKPRRLWHTRLEAAYALGACLYVVAVVVLLISSYRLILVAHIARLLSPQLAEGIGWAIGAVAVLLTTAGLWGELNAAPTPNTRT